MHSIRSVAEANGAMGRIYADFNAQPARLAYRRRQDHAALAPFVIAGVAVTIARPAQAASTREGRALDPNIRCEHTTVRARDAELSIEAGGRHVRAGMAPRSC